MKNALRGHWPEYALEALGVFLFMVSACAFGTLLEHPDSPAPRALPSPLARRALMGLAMGATAVGLIYSPLGKRSGAHLNPAVTLTFLTLGKVKPPDALLYAAAHFAGALLGVAAGALALGPLLASPSVRYVATVPGRSGPLVAFAAELAISFLLMLVVLRTASSPRWERWTGLFAGLLVATYVTVEAPLSGMSMNPARTFGSALHAREFTSWWIYFTAPVLGMLLAAGLHRRISRGVLTHCAKLHHRNRYRCIFCASSH